MSSMGSIVYHIYNGTGLLLAIDKDNTAPGSQIIVASWVPWDPDQIWTWVYNPGTQSAILYNPGRNMYAAPQSLEKGSPIVINDMALSVQFSGANTFQVTSLAAAAVRPPADINLNMNALGSTTSPGTKVGLYTWKGGQPNEVWTSKMSVVNRSGQEQGSADRTRGDAP